MCGESTALTARLLALDPPPESILWDTLKLAAWASAAFATFAVMDPAAPFTLYSWLAAGVALVVGGIAFTLVEAAQWVVYHA